MTEDAKDTKRKSKPPVRDKALSLLAKSDRTEKQIRDSLARSGYKAEEIDDAIDFLIDYGYVDDTAYAKKYLEVLIARGRGRRRAAEEMHRHGLSRAIVDEALDSYYSVEAERELALAHAQKVRAALADDIPRYEAAARISRRLQAQGFGYDIISWATDRAFD
jgi:regulatory protein